MDGYAATFSRRRKNSAHTDADGSDDRPPSHVPRSTSPASHSTRENDWSVSTTPIHTSTCSSSARQRVVTVFTPSTGGPPPATPSPPPGNRTNAAGRSGHSRRHKQRSIATWDGATGLNVQDTPTPPPSAPQEQEQEREWKASLSPPLPRGNGNLSDETLTVSRNIDFDECLFSTTVAKNEVHSSQHNAVEGIPALLNCEPPRDGARHADPLQMIHRGEIDRRLDVDDEDSWLCASNKPKNGCSGEQASLVQPILLSPVRHDSHNVTISTSPRQRPSPRLKSCLPANGARGGLTETEMRFARLRRSIEKLLETRKALIAAVWSHVQEQKAAQPQTSVVAVAGKENSGKATLLVSQQRRTVSSTTSTSRTPSAESRRQDIPSRPSRQWMVAKPHAHGSATEPCSRKIYRELLLRNHSDLGDASQRVPFGLAPQHMNRPLSRSHPPPAPVPRTPERHPVGELPSMTFLMLRAAYTAAYARTFLAAAAYRAAMAREQAAIVLAMQGHRRQRRCFAAWRAIVRGEHLRRHALVGRALRQWMSWMGLRQQCRDIVRRYVRCVRRRLGQVHAVQRVRAAAAFAQWRSVARDRRIAAALAGFAKTHIGSSLQRLVCPSRPVSTATALGAVHANGNWAASTGGGEPENGVVRKPRLAGLGTLRQRATVHIPPTAPRPSPYEGPASIAIARLLFGHWRRRLADRRDEYQASTIAACRLTAVCLARWHRRTSRRRQLHDEAMRFESAEAAITIHTVEVLAQPRNEAHDQRAAELVSRLQAQRHAFAHWRQRYLHATADRYCAYNTRVCALALWRRRAAERTTHLRVKRLIFSVWRAKLRHYRCRVLADDWHVTVAARRALRTWREAAAAARQLRTFRLRAVMAHWRDETRAAQARHVLLRGKLQRHWDGWRQWIALQRRRQGQAVLAVAVHRRLVQYRALRHWVRRWDERRRDRGLFAVQVEMRQKRAVQWCFSRWRSRMFERTAQHFAEASRRQLAIMGMNMSQDETTGLV